MTPAAPRVVVAPDKFKGTVTAAEAAAALARGLRSARPDLTVVELPVADGGEGTVAAALARGFEPVTVTAAGPLGDPVEAVFARRGDAAVIEMSAASGLHLVAPAARDPLRASSRGTGELVRAALDLGCRHLLVGIGGSACTDGGAGLAAALGARLLDESGVPLPDGGAALARLSRLDLSALDPRLRGCRVEVACDVDSPLTGPTGSSAVYAPQKGADASQVAQLDAALVRLAGVVRATTGRDLAAQPGVGAGGGTAFGAVALAGARLVPGAAAVLDLLGLDTVLRGAVLAVTGEGCLDAQTLAGKAPLGVARAAGRAGVPVIAVAGSVALDATRLVEAGFRRSRALTALEPDPARCHADAAALLERTGALIAREDLAAIAHPVD